MWTFANTGNDACLRVLLERPDCNVHYADDSNDQGENTVIAAAKADIDDKTALGTISLLVDHQATANKADDCHVTALWHALNTGKTECAKFLVAAGTDVNYTCCFEVSPLMLASRRADGRDLMKMLIDNGADVNATSRLSSDDVIHPTETTALAEAAGRGHMDNVQFLLSQGAKPTGVEVTCALLHGHNEIIKYLVRNTMVQPAVVQCQVKPKCFTFSMSPLVVACLRNNKEMVDFFIRENFMVVDEILRLKKRLHVFVGKLNSDIATAMKRLTSSPPTMISLAADQVSKCVGVRKDRKSQVNSLGLPVLLQKYVLNTAACDSEGIARGWSSVRRKWKISPNPYPYSPNE